MKKTLGVLIAFSLLIIIIDYLPEKNTRDQAFSYKNFHHPWIIAHGGAKLLFPENTFIAFDSSVAMGVDMLEMDVRLTRDSQLVCLHNETIDETSNGKGKAIRYSLLVLKQLNFGKKFKDLNGKYPYKNKHVRIPSLEQVLVKYPQMPLTIELKDKGKNGRKAARYLKYLLNKYKRSDDVIVASFDQATLDYFRSIIGNKVRTSAARKEVESFVYKSKFFLSKFHQPKAQYLQLPVSASGIDLSSASIISKAHKKGYNIHYWTVNDTTEMRRLINLKVDGIITDRPDLLIKIVKKE